MLLGQRSFFKTKDASARWPVGSHSVLLVMASCVVRNGKLATRGAASARGVSGARGLPSSVPATDALPYRSADSNASPTREADALTMSRVRCAYRVVGLHRDVVYSDNQDEAEQ